MKKSVTDYNSEMDFQQQEENTKSIQKAKVNLKQYYKKNSG